MAHITQGNTVDSRVMPHAPTYWRWWQAGMGMLFHRVHAAEADLTGKWVLITGANNGIGREAALQFAAWGAHLILACRDPPPHEARPETVVKECQMRAKEAGHSSTIEWWSVDMADLTTVDTLAKRWLQTRRPLHLLLNNAGMADGRGPVQLTKDGFEVVHQVNFLSHTLLTYRLLDSLASDKDARIVCTTSCMHYFGTFNIRNANAGGRAYANNKLYFQIWLTELQKRMLASDKYSGIVVNGVHPGYVQTGIWERAKELRYNSLLAFFLNVALSFIGINARQGSVALINAATDPAAGTVANGGRGGAKYYNRTTEYVAMPETQDSRCRNDVWNLVDRELTTAGFQDLHPF